MSLERRVKYLETKVGVSQPRVVWVNPGETLAQACERQLIRYESPMMINTGIGNVFFVKWKDDATT